MRHTNPLVDLEGSGGRRSGTDRRWSSTRGYGPERRSDQDRRSGLDRRIVQEDCRNLTVPKRKTDFYIELLRTHRGLFYGTWLGLLSWAMLISIILIIPRIF